MSAWDSQTWEDGSSSGGVVELATDGETAAGVVVQGNDSRLASATRTTRGTSKIGTVSNGLYSKWSNAQSRGRGAHAHTLTTGAFAAGALRLGLSDGAGGTFSEIAINVTVLGALGTADICAYSVGETLGTCVLLWSGQVSTATTGFKNKTFASGTFTTAGAAYNDGSGNFVVPDGEQIIFGALFLVAAATISGNTAANAVTFGVDPTAPTTIRSDLAFAGLGALPANLTGATLGTGTPPFIALKET